MGQTEHRAYVKMKEAQEKSQRSPSYSSYKEEAKDAELEWYKAKEKEREEEDLSRQIWGF